MRLFVVLAMLFLTVGTARAQDLDPLVTGDLRSGIRILENAVGEAETAEEASHLRYLIARAHQQAGDCRTAIAEFDALEEQASEDDLWVSRARFGRSECLARMEQPGLALSAFFEEAERLTDPARREALAEELMEFARTDMTPDDDGVVPNGYRAQQIFGVVLTLAPNAEFSDEAEHHRARLSNDIVTLRARVSQDPNGEWACRDRAALAFAIGQTGWGGVPAQEHWYVATECGGTEARRAARALADLEYSARAIHALDAAIPNIDDIDRAQPLRQRLVQQLLALGDADRARIELNAAIETSSGRDLDAVLALATAFVGNGHFDDARGLWTIAESLTTRSSIRDRIAAEWAATRRSEAEEARRAGDLEGAIAFLGLLEEEVPREQAAARELTGRLLADAGRSDEAISILMTAETSSAARAAVELLELEGRMGEALLIRQEFGLGLPGETLEVAAERAFRTNEEAELSVRTTGLSEVELRFHAIDVEDHLRSIGTLAGIGNLDVDLIAPESTRTADLRAETETGEGSAATYGPVSLGRLAAGLRAVEVVGETQQASALVRVSDLELTVRSVAGDFVVLVVNARTGRTVRGANIIVTDGSQVVDEGSTDADGLYRGHNTSGSLEVLAVSSAGSAWTTIVSGGGDAVSLRSREETRRPVRAQLDRTEAVPGELVRIYANIAQGELPRVMPTEEITLELRVGGEILDEWTAELDSGVLQSSYRLPDDLPAGSYSVVFEGQFLPFTVGRQAPHGSTTFVEQVAPVRPGEDATFRATHRGESDEPIVGLPVFGDLDDGQGSRLLGHTDANGVLEFTAPTSDLRHDQFITASNRRMAIALTAPAGRLELDHVAPTPGAASRVQIRWPETDAASARIRVTQDAAGPPSHGTLDRVAPVIGNPSNRTVFSAAVSLSGDEGAIELPGLPAGTYSLAVQTVDSEHQFASATERFVVREPGVQPRLSGLAGDRVAPGSAHELEVIADSSLPMLATLEGVGIIDALVLNADARWQVSLPVELAGEGAFALSHVGEAAERVPTHTLPFTVARDLTVEIVPSDDLGIVTLEVTDGAGEPVTADVFVSVQPESFEPIESSGGFFARTITRLVGASAASAPWTHRGQTSAIDLDVLAWQEEQRFDAMDDMPFAIEEAESWANQRVETSGFARGAGGLGAVGYGAGAAGSVTANASMAVAPQPAGYVSARRAPAAWNQVRTNASGRAVIQVDTDALSRGWYSIRATALETTPVPRSDTRIVTGDVTRTTGVWVDRDSTPSQQSPTQALGATQVITRILAPGETLELEIGDASSASVRVGGAGADQTTRALLAPDGVANSDGSFWREQERVLAVLSEVSPDDDIRMRRWIASRGSATNSSGLPARFQSTNTLLSRLETLAEDQVPERARAILAVARQTPSNSQAQAALMHLGRASAVRDANAVGASHSRHS